MIEAVLASVVLIVLWAVWVDWRARKRHEELMLQLDSVIRAAMLWDVKRVNMQRVPRPDVKQAVQEGWDHS